MPTRRAGLRRAWPWLILALAGTLSCGASIQAVYEGDVRFEHCMALDSRPDVKPTIRRACWEEWQKFYTFGQTRDRVEFAHLREKQLSMASDFDEGDWVESSRNSKAVPEPTSALAPPPMMMGTAQPSQPAHDGGAPVEAGAAPASSAKAGPGEPGTPPSSDCAEECHEGWNLCRQDCKTPACEKACTGKYKRCMRKCF